MASINVSATYEPPPSLPESCQQKGLESITETDATQQSIKKLKLEDSPPGNMVAASLLKTSSFYLDRRPKSRGKKRSVSFTFSNEQNLMKGVRRSSLCLGGAPANGMTELMMAARDGCILQTQRLLASGADPLAVDKRGFDALMYAVRDGNETIVKLLLNSKQVNVNTRTKHGLTHLLYAAINGHASCIQLLLQDVNETQKKELVDVTDNCGFTPLMGAAQNGHVQTVAVLLEHGATLEKKDKHGMTALFWAVTGNRLEVVSLLISKGANVNTTERKHKSPLLYTVVKQQTEMAKLLLSKGAQVCERVRLYCLMDHVKQTSMKRKWDEDTKKLNPHSNAAA